MTTERDVLLNEPIADTGVADDGVRREEKREANLCGVKLARGWNHNVLFTLLMIGVWGLSDSIWAS